MGQHWTVGVQGRPLRKPKVLEYHACAQKLTARSSEVDPADPPETQHPVQNRPWVPHAGGQDYGSLHKLPQINSLRSDWIRNRTKMGPRNPCLIGFGFFPELGKTWIRIHPLVVISTEFGMSRHGSVQRESCKIQTPNSDPHSKQNEAEKHKLPDCSLRQGSGGMEFARFGSRTCFWR